MFVAFFKLKAYFFFVIPLTCYLDEKAFQPEYLNFPFVQMLLSAFLQRA